MSQRVMTKANSFNYSLPQPNYVDDANFERILDYYPWFVHIRN